MRSIIKRIYLPAIILALIFIISCGKKPLTSDIQEVKTIYIEIKQDFSVDDNSIDLDLDNTLSQLLGKIGIKSSKNIDSCDAVLSINISGKTNGVTFETEKLTFYESADIKGKAKLKINGFLPLTEELNYKMRYGSTTYNKLSNNRNPKQPLNMSCQKEFNKMIYNFWGPEIFFNIWDLPKTRGGMPDLSGELYLISDDPLSILPVLFNILEDETSIYHNKAKYLLLLLTNTEKQYNGHNDRTDKVLQRNTEIKKIIENNQRYTDIIKTLNL